MAITLKIAAGAALFTLCTYLFYILWVRTRTQSEALDVYFNGVPDWLAWVALLGLLSGAVSIISVFAWILLA